MGLLLGLHHPHKVPLLCEHLDPPLVQHQDVPLGVPAHVNWLLQISISLPTQPKTL